MHDRLVHLDGLRRGLHPEVLVIYRNGRRLARPRKVQLSSSEPDGPAVEDVLNPEDFGIDPGKVLTEGAP